MTLLAELQQFVAENSIDDTAETGRTTKDATVTRYGQ